MKPRISFGWFVAPLVIGVISAGALSGSSIGSAAILKNGSQVDYGAPQDGIIAEYEPDQRKSLPDHYPLVTPTGTVPVAALATHGRLRHARNQRPEPMDERPLEPTTEWELDRREIDRLANWQPGREVGKSSNVRSPRSEHVSSEPSEHARFGGKGAKTGRDKSPSASFTGKPLSTRSLYRTVETAADVRTEQAFAAPTN